MPAYIIVEVDVHDPVQYEDYKKMSYESLQPYEGKFIVRGGAAVNMEGDWQPKRIVVIEFPMVEKAKAWWASEEYAPGKALRQRTATSRMILVEGVNP
jgi:uncharacterized protein (DUF1330 family)